MERLKAHEQWLAERRKSIFTFQYGEIKSIFKPAARNAENDLHSSMERLKGRKWAEGTSAEENLHSSMERLKGAQKAGWECALKYLHSSMERLKEACRGGFKTAKKIFTFQYGEIKRVQKTFGLNLKILIYIPVWRD